VVPADGTVVEGRASIDEAILTGEAAPRARAKDDAVLTGSIVRDGAIVMRVAAAGAGTRLSAIERLVERAAGERPRLARVADRVATWFVAALLVVAAGTALAWAATDAARALAVTFAVLVVSCPCALSLATPAALAAAAGALSRAHVVVARGDALEALARVTHFVIDKTGTLTTGRMTLRATVPTGDGDPASTLALATALEAHSDHPLAVALRAARRASPAPLPAVDAIRVVPGRGVEGTLDGHALRLGRPDWVAALSGRDAPATAFPADPEVTLVALGDASGPRALFAFGDALRPGAALFVRRLRALGIVPVLLSGDHARSVAAIGAALGIEAAHGGQLPEDKKAAVARLQAQGAVVAMAGDGVNDAPALAQAQVSVTLGAATPIAQWTADVVVLGDELPRIADAIVQARRTLRVVRQNLGWAALYNGLAIPAAAFGLLTPLMASAGMAASSLAVVGNALRLSRLKSAAGDGQPAAAAGGE
jgi:Cu2+-exporting ATPase